MIWLLKPDQPKATEFAPAMDEGTEILPGLPSVMGKPVHVAFDGGRMTSDAGILLLAAIEQRLGIAERLTDCIEDPRAPERVRHGLAEMIRYRALLIAAGYPDGNDCDALKSDPAFKMAVGRLPESGDDLCSQPTISRLENLPGPTALKRMMAAMVEVFCDSFEQVPRRIVLDIDDTEDRVHGGQQLALFNAYYDSRCFQPIHIYEATTGKPVAIILRPGKTPDGAEVTLVLRRDRPHSRPLAGGRHRGSRRQPLRQAGGDGVVRAQAHRLHLRPCRQPGAAAPGQPSRRGCRHRLDRRRGRQGPPLRRVPLCRQGLERRSPRHRDQLGWPAQDALRKDILRKGAGREPDQGPQTSPRLRPHLVHQGERQPVPPADPHRRLLAATDLARSGAPHIVLARRSVRYDPPLPDQGRRARHRDGHPHQDRPADCLPLPNRVCHARWPRHQAAAVNDGAVYPRTNPSAQPQTPITASSTPRKLCRSDPSRPQAQAPHE